MKPTRDQTSRAGPHKLRRHFDAESAIVEHGALCEAIQASTYAATRLQLCRPRRRMRSLLRERCKHGSTLEPVDQDYLPVKCAWYACRGGASSEQSCFYDGVACPRSKHPAPARIPARAGAGVEHCRIYPGTPERYRLKYGHCRQILYSRSGGRSGAFGSPGGAPVSQRGAERQAIGGDSDEAVDQTWAGADHTRPNLGRCRIWADAGQTWAGSGQVRAGLGSPGPRFDPLRVGLDEMRLGSAESWLLSTRFRSDSTNGSGAHPNRERFASKVGWLRPSNASTIGWLG